MRSLRDRFSQCGKAKAPPVSGQWTSGLCDCFQDCKSCCCAHFCSCVVVGRIAEIIDQGVTSCFAAGCLFYCLTCSTGCGFLYTYSYRSRLRGKYNLPPKPCHDCCVDFWCLNCSLAQQYRELQYRGIDPSKGWAGTSAPDTQKMVR